MSGLLFLTTQDFHITEGTRGKLLAHSIPEFSLILFYSTQCQYCQKIIPLFKKLPGYIRGCQFGMLNVSKNKAIVHMSANTIAPIEYVPYIILYSDGKPFMRYEGAHDGQSIKNFIVEVNKRIQHKQQFSKEQSSQKNIPAYTIGKPLYGDTERCYLEFNSAYIKN